MTRRVPLLALALALAPAGARAKERPHKTRVKKGPRYPPLELFFVNFHKPLSVRLYDEKGRFSRHEARILQRWMRCHKTGRRHSIHPHLMELMYRVQRHYGGARLEIVSGFRDRSVARTKGSYHIKGRAVDFHVEGVRNEEVRDWVRTTFHNVGVGYYPNSTFVHMDVRERNAYWVDYSRPGEAPRYLPAPAPASDEESDSKEAGESADATEPAAAAGTAGGAEANGGTAPAGAGAAAVKPIGGGPAFGLSGR